MYSAPGMFMVPSYMSFILLEAQEYLDTIFKGGFRDHNVCITSKKELREWIMDSQQFVTYGVPTPLPLWHHTILHQVANKTWCRYKT
jgi:hypothetical protein